MADTELIGSTSAPLHKRWWFWTAISVMVLAVVAGQFLVEDSDQIGAVNGKESVGYQLAIIDGEPSKVSAYEASVKQVAARCGQSESAAADAVVTGTKRLKSVYGMDVSNFQMMEEVLVALSGNNAGTINCNEAVAAIVALSTP